MASGSFRFDRFVLDPRERRLKRDSVPVELSARYLDALDLLLREAGRLVSKDRFLEEVWRGVPVTDEALTQCIKTLRRQLGDDAARPRFIETVPKYGYRFIAPADWIEDAADPAEAIAARSPGRRPHPWREFFVVGAAGTIGAGVAGIVGGLFYGFVGASQPLDLGGGAASILLVLLWLTIAAALTGGAGVSFGIAAGGYARPGYGTIIGGALGGLIVGGVVKLLGLDAFNLLLGRSPGDITGAFEGALLGGTVGFAAWLERRGAASSQLRRSVALAALVGGIGAILILLLGGRLMGGSLDLLAGTFPASRLRLDQLGSLFGEAGFGPVARLVTGCLEGALFAGCIVGAMALLRRSPGNGR